MSNLRIYQYNIQGITRHIVDHVEKTPSKAHSFCDAKFINKYCYTTGITKTVTLTQNKTGEPSPFLFLVIGWLLSTLKPAKISV